MKIKTIYSDGDVWSWNSDQNGQLENISNTTTSSIGTELKYELYKPFKSYSVLKRSDLNKPKPLYKRIIFSILEVLGYDTREW
jgi:hypothetical protein